MPEASRRRVGRPVVSSRPAIQDAASELFLERGYPESNVDEIARRAGVSRSSFFNYFSAKSDVLWAEVDAATASARSLAGLIAALEASGPSAGLTFADDMHAQEGISESTPPRVERIAALLIAAVREGRDPLGLVAAPGTELPVLLRLDGSDADLLRIRADAVAALVIVCIRVWSSAGVGRGRLLDRLAAAVGLVPAE